MSDKINLNPFDHIKAQAKRIEALEADITVKARLLTSQAYRIKALEAALRIFADDENWRYGRRLDPNGSRFDGIKIARTALAGGQDK